MLPLQAFAQDGITIDDPEIIEQIVEGNTDAIQEYIDIPEEEASAIEQMSVQLASTETLVASGSCGKDVTWSLYDTDADSAGDKLVISGSGDMTNYEQYDSYAPWYSYRAKITDIVIESGVKSIGSFAMRECRALRSVTIPKTVASIGSYAFYQCSAIQSISFPEGLSKIGNHTFSGCTALNTIKFPGSLTSIGSAAFYNCTKLTNVSVANIEGWLNIEFSDVTSNPVYYAKSLYVNGADEGT